MQNLLETLLADDLKQFAGYILAGTPRVIADSRRVTFEYVIRVDGDE